ncbi:ATP-binding cassette domain-containing protein [Mucilaginibacter agri]|uniref:ATP-binding cassette domain-containing protein n=1 Tax=Mucilaginibacter agri TaxID=2695265 RepID=A0A965ZDH7_9SPHI|nr:ATP-binding cassette domain-containing protein [Mucilaginibacter agri]NCD68024.1 ATP-binding cassette domain-containing protein [Mucilaginibacter agri]
MEGEESPSAQYFRTIAPCSDLTLKNICFKYPGAGNNDVLSNINLTIPAKETTAIVGMSGSGKTTVLKLLLGFYSATKGEIKIDDVTINQILPTIWRKKCGVVMQEGFIFSDTVINNIAPGEDNPDLKELWNAIEMARLDDFINSPPLGLYTKIGLEGNGLSQGQKQRLLIARAIYKNRSTCFLMKRPMRWILSMSS